MFRPCFVHGLYSPIIVAFPLVATKSNHEKCTVVPTRKALTLETCIDMIVFSFSYHDRLTYTFDVNR